MNIPPFGSSNNNNKVDNTDYLDSSIKSTSTTSSDVGISSNFIQRQIQKQKERGDWNCSIAPPAAPAAPAADVGSASPSSLPSGSSSSVGATYGTAAFAATTTTTTAASSTDSEEEISLKMSSADKVKDQIEEKLRQVGAAFIANDLALARALQAEIETLHAASSPSESNVASLPVAPTASLCSSLMSFLICFKNNDIKDEGEWEDFGKKKKKKRKKKNREKEDCGDKGTKYNTNNGKTSTTSTQKEVKPKAARHWNSVRRSLDLPEKAPSGVRWADLIDDIARDNIQNITLDDVPNLDDSGRDAELYASINNPYASINKKVTSIGNINIDLTSDSEDDSFADLLENINTSNDEDEGGKGDDKSNKKGEKECSPCEQSAEDLPNTGALC